jgi:hypothetical protein
MLCMAGGVCTPRCAQPAAIESSTWPPGVRHGHVRHRQKWTARTRFVLLVGRFDIHALGCTSSAAQEPTRIRPRSTTPSTNTVPVASCPPVPPPRRGTRTAIRCSKRCVWHQYRMNSGLSRLARFGSDKWPNARVQGGQNCEYCDSSQPALSHPADSMVDGAPTWWQSPPLSRGRHYESINITIDLEQEFQVAHVVCGHH